MIFFTQSQNNCIQKRRAAQCKYRRPISGRHTNSGRKPPPSPPPDVAWRTALELSYRMAARWCLYNRVVVANQRIINARRPQKEFVKSNGRLCVAHQRRTSMLCVVMVAIYRSLWWTPHTLASYVLLEKTCAPKTVAEQRRMVALCLGFGCNQNELMLAKSKFKCLVCVMRGRRSLVEMYII